MKTKFLIATILFSLIITITGCKWEKIKVDAPSSVSFKTNVLPILSNSCMPCHAADKTSPDLSPANAYESLVGTYVTDSININSNILYDVVAISKTLCL